MAASIREKGGEAIVIPCNVSRRNEVEALVDGTIKQWGGIDILVCNAAVNPVFGPLAKLTDEAFDKIMGANVKATIWFRQPRVPGQTWMPGTRPGMTGYVSGGTRPSVLASRPR